MAKSVPPSNVLKDVGSRFSIKVCPNVNQLILAATTLMFFASFECLLITIMTVGPGLTGQKFQPTQCTVINTFYNGNTSCFVSSVSSSVVTATFPCLQIYVAPESSNANRTKRDLLSGDTAWTVDPAPGNAEMALERSKRAASENSALLMFQNELNFAGNDYLYRRCSYLPRNCPENPETTLTDITNYARNWGRINETYKCFYSAGTGSVMKDKTINSRDMLFSILWPLLGMFLSSLGCAGFWRRNYKHMSRLFIYNSWSAS